MIRESGKRLIGAWNALRRGTLATLGVVVASGAIVVACNEDFVTGPRGAELTLALRNWSDTLVLGESRPVGVLVLDSKGREVIGARVRVSIVAPTVLGTRLDTATAPIGSAVDAISSSDGVQLAPRRTGTSQITVTLADPRFPPATLTLRATIVAAGLRLMSARDTIVTSIGDSSLARASALARAGVGPSAALVTAAGQDVVWSRLNSGALSLLGGGDTLRTVWRAAGMDTLVVSLPFCLRGARCADTLVVRVVQEVRAASALPDTLRAWSLNDTLSIRAAWADARGNPVSGARSAIAPMTAADSAIVGVSSDALAGDTAIVARANGTARLLLRAVGPDGRPLRETQIVAVVRQIARRIRVTPGEADITPSDSVPVLLEARDARGQRIADATFASSVSNGALRGGYVAIAPTAAAGSGVLSVQVTGVALPSTYRTAPFADPAAQTASLVVRVPAPKTAGDTSLATANVLTAVVLDADHTPVAGAWVRFRVPAGLVTDGDSVQSDPSGVVRKRWLLPTLSGRYTATAVVLGAPLPPDSAGAVVIRHSSTVVAGLPSQLVIVGQSASTAALGTPLGTEIVVELRDAFGNAVPLAGISVTVSVGGTGFTLGGTLTATTDSMGRARFSDLVGTGTPGVRVLRFTPGAITGTPALLPTDAPPIDFVSGGVPPTPPAPQVATNLVVTSGNAQTGSSAATLSAPLVVTVTDAVGSPMAGVPVSFAPQPGSGTSGTTSATTAVDGTASTSWTLGALAGPQALLASSSALPGITADFTATATPGVASLALSTIAVGPTSVSPSGSSIVTVRLMDANGNARTSSGGTVALAASGGTLTTVVDNGDGSYTATLTAPASVGVVTITGTLGGNALAQSATVTVTTGAPSAVTSTLTIGSTTLAPTQTTSVTVVVRDAANNVVATVVPADIVIDATLGTLGSVSCAAGTCTAVYTAITAGAATISATIGGADILTSPASVTVAAPVVPATPVSLTLSTITASPTAVTVGGTSAITVQLRDASSNPITTSGGVVALSATSGSLTSVTDNGDGTYSAILTTASTPAVVTISGTLAGSALTGAATVSAFVGAPSSVASTLVVAPTSLTVGDVASVTMVIRDAMGNVLVGAAPSDVVLATTLGTLGSVSCGSGICTATYSATTVGSASISAKIGGSNIGGSPTAVAISATAASLAKSTIGASPASLTADGTSTSAIIVTLRDASGVALTASGGTVTLGATGVGTLSGVTDQLDGTYTATLTAPVAVGSAVVTASLGGSPLTHASNPATVQFIAGAASLTQSTLTASPATVGPNGSSLVTVQLEDSNGNALTVSAGTVVLSTTSGSLGIVTDNGNGSYTATLTAPAATGPVTVSGTLGGAALTQTTTVTVGAGAPSAATSTLAVGATSLAPTQAVAVTVVVRDAANNVITGATASDFVLDATLGTLGSVSCATGTCTATYTATSTGTASISAKIAGSNIVASPASVAITNALTTVLATPTVRFDQDLAYTAFTPVTVAGGTMPYTYYLCGTLPAGMSFSSTTGIISGTPTETLSTTNFVVTVVDAASEFSSKAFLLSVNPPLVTVQAVPSTTLAIGASYAAFVPVTASGGTGPLVFALDGGILPAGVSFDTGNGAISGTASAPIALTAFTVTVTDAIGAVSARTFTLAANGPPSAPAISGIVVGSGQLTVSFTDPASDGGSAITTYEYSTDGGTNWTSRSPASTASPLVIAGLANGTTYQVMVRAVNASGSGTGSAPVAGTPATTPGAPSISAVTPGNGQLSVTFAAPSSTGGSAITNYQYSTDNGASWTTRSPGATTSPLVISGLTNGTMYQVKLRAVNAVGAGTESSPSSGKPVTVPGAPTSLAATGGVTNAALGWTAPAITGGSPLTDYLVEYSTNGTTWSTFAHAASTATAITVTGLTNGTPYQFRVSAINAVGTGLASATGAATPGTPGAPTGVTVGFNQQSATALDGLFSWTAPASNGGSAITDYVIEYKTSASATWTTFAHAVSTATSATVPGLAPSTTYNVRISAKNSAGVGSPSAIATATTVGPSSRLACVQPGNSNSSANSIAIVPCSGTAVGNIILIPVTIANGTTDTPVAITQSAGTSGFTALGTELNGSNQTTIYYKIATAGDVGRVTPYAFQWTGNVKNAISLVTYKTTDGSAPIYASTNGTGVTATSPAVTVSDVSSYTLVYFYTMAGVALSSTTPTVGEWAVSSDLWKNTTAGANNNLAAAITTTDVDKFAAGTTTGRAATTSSMTAATKWNAAVLVLKPAP
jgi:adhesin/invasin